MMQLEPIQRLTKDLKEASKVLNDKEARFLVDSYYSMQDDRIRQAGRIRSMQETEEPNNVLNWLFDNNMTLEKQIARALKSYADGHPVGVWMQEIKGIGGILSAGLLSNIDIKRAPYAGNIWSFAGLNPDAKWEKGKIRPWNASLKTLCWKIGESFVKVSGHDDAFYGKVYALHKQYLIAKNENGDFAEDAKKKLETTNIGKNTDAYKAYSVGKLPKAHIQARAKRFAVKMFLSHLHEVWYEHEFKKPAPVPYVIAHGGHNDFIPAPRGQDMTQYLNQLQKHWRISEIVIDEDELSDEE